ncbi:hypothetical protein AN958_01670 [Leucoagaricus sp. SymC.cos]|nr:hypothetical protein AN958_01670 [Leucoagaricus sp. SymC.cos]
MLDFPWEILKAETLLVISRDLGIKRTLKREEVIAFLRAVQKKGLGPALADEIVKDLNAPPVSSSTNGINGHAIESTPSSPSSPVAPITAKKTLTKPVPSTPSRRISTRKRPAPESEPVEPLFLPGARTDDDGEAEAEEEPEPESISQNTRRRGVKRARVSDPGPGSGPGPARSTRSHGPPAPSTLTTSTSAAMKRSSPRRTRGRPSPAPAPAPAMRRRDDARTRGSTGVSQSAAKRSTRRVRVQAHAEGDSTDADADGEPEVVEDEEDEEEGKSLTGPAAVAAALTKASRESRTPRYGPRGRSSKSSSTAAPAASSSRTTRRMESASAPVTRPKPRPATASRTRSSAKTSTGSDGRALKRTAKPTAKDSLLSPSKIAPSILSRPIRPRGQQQRLIRPTQSPTKVRSRNNDVSNGEDDETSESPREVFYGVVLKKRRIEPLPPRSQSVNGADDNENEGENENGVGDGERSVAVHLDEFVANGLANQQQGGMNGMMNIDPVLDRDDISSFGGSNKENDFSFRNMSESTEGPEVDRLPIGEADAEGDPEHGPQPEGDGDAIMQEAPRLSPQEQAQPQVEELVINDTPRSPLQAVPVLAPEPQPEPQTEPQLEPQAEIQPQVILEQPEQQFEQQFEQQPEQQTVSQPDVQPEPQAQEPVVVLPPPSIS